MASRAEIVGANIIGERGIRYKRNVLAISLIVTVLDWTNAPLGGVSLFDVSLPEDANAENFAWTIALAILVYQFGMLLYYGWTDFLLWHSQVVGEIGIPMRNIYFGNLKEGGCALPSYPQGVGQHVIHTIDKTRGVLKWTAREKENEAASISGEIYRSERASIRRRLRAFIFFEGVLPALWGGYSLIVAALRAFSEEPQSAGALGLL